MAWTKRNETYSQTMQYIYIYKSEWKLFSKLSSCTPTFIRFGTLEKWTKYIQWFLRGQNMSKLNDINIIENALMWIWDNGFALSID